MLQLVFLSLLILEIIAHGHHGFAGYHYDGNGDKCFHGDNEDNFRQYDQIFLFKPQHNPSKFAHLSRQYVGQLIPPGQPWPNDQNGYATFSPVKKPGNHPTILEDRIQDNPSGSNLNRPTFVGTNGGAFVGQLIPSGQPWPANQEDYVTFSPTSRKPSIVDRIKETTTTRVKTTTKLTQADNGNIPQNITTKSPLEYKPSRPSFFGDSGGAFVGQVIPSGQPWPINQEDYNSFSPTSKPNLEDRFKETTTITLTSTQWTTKTPLEYVPNRPTFIGATGGSFVSQVIPPGQQWPANQEDYSNFSQTTKPVLEDRFKETTTTRIVTRPTITKIPNKTSKAPRPTQKPRPTHRPRPTQKPRPTKKPTTKSPLEYIPPSFVGSGEEQLLIPAIQWPYRPTTSKKPTNFEDRFQEITTLSDIRPSQTLSTKSPLEYVPQRPSYAGSSNLGQLVPSGTPWPSRDPAERTTTTTTTQTPQRATAPRATTIRVATSRPTTKTTQRTTTAPRSETTSRPTVLNLGNATTEINKENTPSENTTGDFEIFIVNKENVPSNADKDDECEDDEELVEEDVVNKTGEDIVQTKPNRFGEEVVQSNPNMIDVDIPNIKEEDDKEEELKCEEDEELVDDTKQMPQERIEITMLFTSPLQAVTENVLQEKRKNAVKVTQSSSIRKETVTSSTTTTTITTTVAPSENPASTNLLLEETDKILERIEGFRR